MSSIVVKDAEETKSLVWFRNDLRINDNLALNSALSAPGKVIGFYCFNLSMLPLSVTPINQIFISNAESYEIYLFLAHRHWATFR